MTCDCAGQLNTVRKRGPEKSCPGQTWHGSGGGCLKPGAMTDDEKGGSDW